MEIVAWVLPSTSIGVRLRLIVGRECVCWLQVREVALEAVARARRGDGPTLIEAETYRFRGHSLADPDELRSKEEKAKYQVRACTHLMWLRIRI